MTGPERGQAGYGGRWLWMWEEREQGSIQNRAWWDLQFWLPCDPEPPEWRDHHLLVLQGFQPDLRYQPASLLGLWAGELGGFPQATEACMLTEAWEAGGRMPTVSLA